MNIPEITTAILAKDPNSIIETIKKTSPVSSGKLSILGLTISEKQLLELYEHIKTRPEFVQTVPMMSPEVLKLVLSQDTDVNSKFYLGYTFAHYYCSVSAPEHLSVLLKFKPDLNIKDDSGMTPLYYLMNQKSSPERQKCLGLISVYMGVSTSELENHYSKIKMFIDAFNHLEVVHKINSKNVDDIPKPSLREILKGGFPIDTPIYSGRTLAHCYCALHDFDRLQVVLEFGPDLNLKDDRNMTPRDYLISECPEKLSCLRILDQYEESQKLKSLLTPNEEKLVNKILSGKIDERDIIELNKTTLRKLLIDGFDVNFKISGSKTLAHYFCLFDNPELLEILLEFKPNISFRDHLGKTPLDYVMSNGQTSGRCFDLIAKYEGIDGVETFLRLYEYKLYDFKESCMENIPRFSPLQLERFIKTYINSTGNSINPIRYKGMPLAHFYCQKGKPEHLSVVLKFNPDLMLKDDYGNNPAFYAMVDEGKAWKKCAILLLGHLCN